MMLTNKVKTRIFYSFIAIVFMTFVWFANYSRAKLEKDHVVAIAFIDEVRITGRERFVEVKYHYSIDGKEYTDDASFNQKELSFDNFTRLWHKNVPVVYNKGLLRTISFPLIFPADYKDFNVPFPDSANWILPLIGK